jgi:hypothetical protein
MNDSLKLSVGEKKSLMKDYGTKLSQLRGSL